MLVALLVATFAATAAAQEPPLSRPAHAVDGILYINLPAAQGRAATFLRAWSGAWPHLSPLPPIRIPAHDTPRNGAVGCALSHRDALRKALAVQKRVLGPTHPNTLTTADHLAIALMR